MDQNEKINMKSEKNNNIGERMTKVVLLFLSCKSTTSFFHLSQFLIVASRMEEAVVYRVNKFEISVETS